MIMDTYYVRVGNKTFRINRATGEKELFEEREFERREFVNVNHEWIIKESVDDDE